MKRCALAFAALAAMVCSAVEPSVEIDLLVSHHPWTNAVDITYSVANYTASRQYEYYAVFQAKNASGSVIGAVTNDITTNGSSFGATWYAPFDTTGVVSVTPLVYRKRAGDDYLIIDLEKWTIEYEGIETQEKSNARYNTDEYKTRKMVFRKIPAGTYTVGHADAWWTTLTNTTHTVTAAKDYYMGVFQVTVAQYNRIMNGTDATNSLFPTNYISWTTIRGSAEAGDKVTTGPIATLNSKTGLYFDLPTETMWEIAARAGNTTKYVNGLTSYDGLDAYAWYKDNSGGALHAVGQKLPNEFGLYDMSGNLWDWCRDVMNIADLKTLQSDVFTPVTTGDADNRILRGGYYDTNHTGIDIYVTMRFRNAATDAAYWKGFRLAYIRP